MKRIPLFCAIGFLAVALLTTLLSQRVTEAQSPQDNQLAALQLQKLNSKLLQMQFAIQSLRTRLTVKTRLNMIPVGAILPYHGNIQKIPTNWQLCDGKKIKDGLSPIKGKRTPDLRGHFIRGLEGSQTSGQGGGYDSVGHHSHSIGSHNHEVGSHTHKFKTGDRAGKSGRTVYTYDKANYKKSNYWYYSHIHSGKTENASRGYTAQGGSGSTSSNGSHDNRPRYKAFYYIMKIR